LERQLKERLTGATVLVIAGVIFIPMVLDNPSQPASPSELTFPSERNEATYQSRLTPLEPPLETSVTSILRGSSNSDVLVQIEQEDSGIMDNSLDLPTRPLSTNKPQEDIVQPKKIVNQDSSAIDNKANQGLAGWVIQLGSFSNRTNAERLVSRLQIQGFPAYIEELIGDSEYGYRVRVGPELKHEDAEKTQQSLISNTGIKGIILSYP
jgi:DedD protein